MAQRDDRIRCCMSKIRGKQTGKDVMIEYAVWKDFAVPHSIRQINQSFTRCMHVCLLLFVVQINLPLDLSQQNFKIVTLAKVNSVVMRT